MCTACLDCDGRSGGECGLPGAGGCCCCGACGVDLHCGCGVCVGCKLVKFECVWMCVCVRERET